MKNTPLRQAILSASHKQKRAALILALVTILLLMGAIVAVVLVSTGKLRPTPTNRLQSDYLKAQDSESAAVRQAKAAGHDVNTDTTVVHARASLALLEIQAGDLSSALRRAKSLARGAPKNAEAQYVYGAALTAKGRAHESLVNYQKALQLVKDSDADLKRDILTGYADALVASHKPAEAYANLKQAAAIPPASVDLYVRAATLALQQKNYQNAAEMYLQAQSYDPTDAAVSAGLQQLQRTQPAALKAAQQQARQQQGQEVGNE
ncbi:MAG: hypothetical protein FWD65_04575 [Coriobacteriia bacterium]|nr:hypothetical protein [Coriobacteriia bacterium]